MKKSNNFLYSLGILLLMNQIASKRHSGAKVQRYTSGKGQTGKNGSVHPLHVHYPTYFGDHQFESQKNFFNSQVEKNDILKNLPTSNLHSYPSSQNKNQYGTNSIWNNGGHGYGKNTNSGKAGNGFGGNSIYGNGGNGFGGQNSSKDGANGFPGKSFYGTHGDDSVKNGGNGFPGVSVYGNNGQGFTPNNMGWTPQIKGSNHSGNHESKSNDSLSKGSLHDIEFEELKEIKKSEKPVTSEKKKETREKRSDILKYYVVFFVIMVVNLL